MTFFVRVLVSANIISATVISSFVAKLLILLVFAVFALVCRMSAQALHAILCNSWQFRHELIAAMEIATMKIPKTYNRLMAAFRLTENAVVITELYIVNQDSTIRHNTDKVMDVTHMLSTVDDPDNCNVSTVLDLSVMSLASIKVALCRYTDRDKCLMDISSVWENV